METKSYKTPKSERILYRKPKVDDVDFLFTLNSNPISYQHAPDLVMKTKSQAKELVKLYLAHWDKYGFGYFILLDKEMGKEIGYCGVVHQVYNQVNCLNIGYRLLPEYWGGGLATEAAKTIKYWAQGNFAEPVVGKVALANLSSGKVLEKIGLKPNIFPDTKDTEGIPHQLYN
ncbi:MAG: GNAT family N-acetyltransferase [Micrococcaceae bacterium]